MSEVGSGGGVVGAGGSGCVGWMMGDVGAWVWAPVLPPGVFALLFSLHAACVLRVLLVCAHQAL